MRLTTTLLTAVVVLALVPSGGVAGAGGTASAASTAQEDCSFPVTETDATGTEVTVEEAPQRVVVLQASAAQVMWEVGAEEAVVGMPVKSYTAYLEGSEERTDVLAEDGSVRREIVVGLEPDLVLAPNVVPNETVEQLRSDGLTVYKSGFGKSLEDIYAKTSLYGRMVGQCEQAEQTVSQMRTRVETVREAVAGEERPRVLYEFYNFTAGNGTFVHEILETAGGDNVAANAGIEGYARISEEVVADRDPEWVVVPSDAPLPSGEPYESTTAYRQNQTLTVNANYMNQPAPRVVRPMTKLTRAFHPEAYAAANATATPTPTPTAMPTGTEPGGTGSTGTKPATPGGEASGTSQPGFGLPAVLAALAALAAILVGRRR
jgi:iron complex transport system substrate-binding protein